MLELTRGQFQNDDIAIIGARDFKEKATMSWRGNASTTKSTNSPKNGREKKMRGESSLKPTNDKAKGGMLRSMRGRIEIQERGARKKVRCQKISSDDGK